MRRLMGKRLAVGILAAAMMMASTVPAFAADGWKRNETGWWYEYDNGSYPTDSWQMINGVWYHFNQAGYMDTGWVLDKDGRWYFTNADGAMLTGWVVVENQGYYLNPISNGYKGAMAVGTVEIDGQTYTFDASGACTSGFPKPGKAYYKNGVEVTNQQKSSGSGSGSSNGGSNTGKDDVLEDLNQEIENKIEEVKKNPAYSEIIGEDKAIKEVSAVGGSEEEKEVTVTLGTEEVQKDTSLREVQDVANDLVDSIVTNSDEVKTVSLLGKDFTWDEAKAHMNEQLDSDRTLDTLSDSYTVKLTLDNGESVTYTVNVEK